MDGTSQAVPFVAGAVALLQSINTNIRAAEINDIIVAVATKDVLKLERNEDDANVLAYVRDVPVSVEVEVHPSSSKHTYTRAVVRTVVRVLNSMRWLYFFVPYIRRRRRICITFISSFVT